MDDHIQQSIHQAAQAAFDAVWDNSAVPETGHSGALQGAMMGVEDRSGEAYRDTVRAKCAELGFEERDYYLADPDAAVVFEPECMAEDRAVAYREEHIQREYDDLADIRARETAAEDYESDQRCCEDSAAGSGLGF